MGKSEILRQDHEAIITLHKRMSPEERLVACFNHSRFLFGLYQAGVKYRSRFSLSARELPPGKS